MFSIPVHSDEKEVSNSSDNGENLTHKTRQTSLNECTRRTRKAHAATGEKLNDLPFQLPNLCSVAGIDR
jgi:hypothetical protein